MPSSTKLLMQLRRRAKAALLRRVGTPLSVRSQTGSGLGDGDVGAVPRCRSPACISPLSPLTALLTYALARAPRVVVVDHRLLAVLRLVHRSLDLASAIVRKHGDQYIGEHPTLPVDPGAHTGRTWSKSSSQSGVIPGHTGRTRPNKNYYHD